MSTSDVTSASPKRGLSRSVSFAPDTKAGLAAGDSEVHLVSVYKKLKPEPAGEGPDKQFSDERPASPPDAPFWGHVSPGYGLGRGKSLWMGTAPIVELGSYAPALRDSLEKQFENSGEPGTYSMSICENVELLDATVCDAVNTHIMPECWSKLEKKVPKMIRAEVALCEDQLKQQMGKVASASLIAMRPSLAENDRLKQRLVAAETGLRELQDIVTPLKDNLEVMYKRDALLARLQADMLQILSKHVDFSSSPALSNLAEKCKLGPLPSPPPLPFMTMPATGATGMLPLEPLIVPPALPAGPSTTANAEGQLKLTMSTDEVLGESDDDDSSDDALDADPDRD